MSPSSTLRPSRNGMSSSPQTLTQRLWLFLFVIDHPRELVLRLILHPLLLPRVEGRLLRRPQPLPQALRLSRLLVQDMFADLLEPHARDEVVRPLLPPAVLPVVLEERLRYLHRLLARVDRC